MNNKSYGYINKSNSTIPIEIVVRHLAKIFSINCYSTIYGQKKVSISFSHGKPKRILNPEYSFLDFINPLVKTKEKFFLFKEPKPFEIVNETNKILIKLNFDNIYASYNGRLELKYFLKEEMDHKVKKEKLLNKLDNF